VHDHVEGAAVAVADQVGRERGEGDVAPVVADRGLETRVVADRRALPADQDGGRVGLRAQVDVVDAVGVLGHQRGGRGEDHRGAVVRRDLGGAVHRALGIGLGVGDVGQDDLAVAVRRRGVRRSGARGRDRGRGGQRQRGQAGRAAPPAGRCLRSESCGMVLRGHGSPLGRGR
jgi:hypothetical protein